MIRETNSGATSNTVAFNPAGRYKYYTVPYASGATQEAIYLPDVNGVDVTLSFDSAGSASVESTDSPPDLIEAGTAVWVAWPSGSVSVSTTAFVRGPLAIRVNRSSGTPRITVRA